MRISDLELGDKPLFLAPMEGVTDAGFRMLCKRYGVAMVYTEFINAEAIVRSVKPILVKMKVNDSERPIGIQLYGREKDAIIEAAKIVEEAKPDVIDLNFGCPVKKIANKGAGAGMLNDVPLLLEITRGVVKAVNVPVTVKTRLGWDNNTIIIEDLAERLQDCGVKALTVHARTRAQMYTGKANWAYIGRLKSNPRLKIPIIGNGDIATSQDVYNAFSHFCADGVMIGRAAIGQPWVFKEMRIMLDGEQNDVQKLTIDEKLDVLEEILNINISTSGEYGGILHTRKHLANTPLFKGIPNFNNTRKAMLQVSNATELKDILQQIRQRLRNL